MITLNELLSTYKYRIEDATSIDTIRSIERELIGLYSQSEITELTKSRREDLAKNLDYRNVNFTRCNLQGVFENRMKFDSILKLSNETITLGLFKTARQAHEQYLKYRDILFIFTLLCNLHVTKNEFEDYELSLDLSRII